MKITKTELKNLIKETLREELGRKSSNRIVREFLANKKIYHNLSDFYRDNENPLNSHDYYDILEDEELCETMLAKWFNVEELQNYSAPSVFDQLKSDNNKVLLLHGNDLGDGHGDRMSYIFSVNDDLYFYTITSNGHDIQKINSYTEFKNHIYFEDFWQDIGIEKLEDCTSEDDYYDIPPELISLLQDGKSDEIEDVFQNSGMTYNTSNTPIYSFVLDGMPEKFLNQEVNSKITSKENIIEKEGKILAEKLCTKYNAITGFEATSNLKIYDNGIITLNLEQYLNYGITNLLDKKFKSLDLTDSEIEKLVYDTMIPRLYTDLQRCYFDFKSFMKVHVKYDAKEADVSLVDYTTDIKYVLDKVYRECRYTDAAKVKKFIIDGIKQGDIIDNRYKYAEV